MSFPNSTTTATAAAKGTRTRRKSYAGIGVHGAPPARLYNIPDDGKAIDFHQEQRLMQERRLQMRRSSVPARPAAISRPLLRDPHRNSRPAPRRRVLARFLLTRPSVSHNRPTVLTVLSAVLTATTRSGRRWKNEMAIPFGSLRPRHTTVLSRRDVGQTRRLATPASKRTRNDA
ncbi:hypothetical protein ACOMHN_048312 [Nucella lapillus]